MKKLAALVLFLLCLTWNACAAPTPMAPAPTTALKSGTIRVGFSTVADAGDVPSLMAHDLLREEGYTVQTTFFSAADLEVAALAQGDVDIGNGSTRTHWAAVAKGAGIRTVMEQVALLWSILAKPEIKTCADLQGRRYAISSLGSLNAALTKAYLQQNCPGTEPEYILIASSGNRAAALLAGEIDATSLELADVLQLQDTAPGKFHTLFDFGKSLPELKSTGIHVNLEFAQTHAEMVHDYLRAVLTIHRRIRENPELLETALVKYLSLDSNAAKAIAAAYLERHVWELNGGMPPDAIPYSVAFFQNSGSLPKELDANTVADPTYLNAVLDEIGRK